MFRGAAGGAIARAVVASAAGAGPAFAQDPNDATIYEVQNGLYGVNSFVVCDSVTVTGAATNGFWVEEPAGGARSGIWINAISGVPPPLGPGTRVTVGGLYKEVSGNSEINIGTGIGGYANVVDSTGTGPAPAVLHVGNLRTGSPTAEDWEGVLVVLDSVLSADTTASSDWRVVEMDGEAPGETLLVDNMSTYARPAPGTFITSLTGIMQFIGGANFALEPRNNFDILVPDSLPPATVASLAAASGSFEGEINLTWTAPGDDGSVGTAFGYTMRRNTVPITDLNWGTSTAVTGVPTPAVAGTLQSMVVVGLTPGQVYHFAIRARDEVGNESGVSNSPSAAASTNPPRTYQVFWANLHSHTILSDGMGTVTEAFTHARDTANIDILAITDHTHYLTASEYTSIQAAAAAFNAAGGFVALPAQELGIANATGFGHMNVWDAPSIAAGEAYENLTAAYNFVISVNKPASFNHPVAMNGESIFNNLAFNFTADPVLAGIEVRNGKRSSDYESQYFQALNNGWHVGALANQDNHQKKWGDQMNGSSGNDIYLTGVLADSLTKDAVMEALYNRRFYACEINPSTDRVTLGFSADGRVMGSTYTANDPYIAITASATSGTNLSSYNLYRNGALRKTGTINATSWNFSFTDTVPGDGNYYYFIRLLQTDFDRTWSSPIWVTVSGVTGIAGGLGARGQVELLANHPNPFNPITSIEYSLPSKMTVDLAVFDATGRRVKTLARGERVAGPHTAVWDGTDDHGNDVASGVYLSRLETSAAVLSRKMVLLK
jgi:hypothetical protein